MLKIRGQECCCEEKNSKVKVDKDDDVKKDCNEMIRPTC